MKTLSGLVAAGILTISVLSMPTASEATEVTAKARSVVEVLDHMDVERKWIAGHHINWETGLPDGLPEPFAGRHTHCSAFVASAAEKLGIHILRPPEHPQELLANAQNEWLATAGKSEGWRSLSGPIEAQAAANLGDFVVASYHNHHDNKPGHIAIIRAGDESREELMQEGPHVLQAGTTNSADISLRQGFAGHPSAWSDNEIRYYAHGVSR